MGASIPKQYLPILGKPICTYSFETFLGMPEVAEHGAAVLGVQAKATIKEADGDLMVTRTLERAALWEVQTPQVIEPGLLRAGFELVREKSLDVTDDVSIIEALGKPVKITSGSYKNIKADGDVSDEEEFEDIQERAFLIVRRVVSDARPIEAKTSTVTVEVYNAGTTTALNVLVEEQTWPPEFFTVSGDLTASYEAIPAGATVRLSYQVTPKAVGPYAHQPTRVRYQALEEDESSTQVTISAWLEFKTITIGEQWKLKALDAGSWITGGHVTTVLGWQLLLAGVAAALIAYYGFLSYKSFKVSSANRRRQRALEALQAMEEKTK
ncbi:hypothetical protein QBZ16_000893 [Prototheca wickerhamii]|uniref:Uncharacterized protein n=1 Tax=Prototheca wickerhamii TaxID=3111 RepID=A0AAD9MKH4_PROWI|nr:hypothetical protein QBZ16_000893 [Prototheca wickerhamii]